MKKSLSILLVLISISLHAQDSNYGEIHGQWRNYWLNSFNKGDLKDFKALATGLNLRFQYTFSEALQFSVGGYSTYNLNVQDLTVPDEQTGKVGRYTSMQFDRLNLDNRLVVLLGELNLKYSSKSHQVRIGRMKVKTPFLNPQDGNMIPTLVEGGWYQFKKPKVVTQLGLITRIAPRSTNGFFGIGESIGKYPVGRNNQGTRSLYAGNTSSKFLVVGGVKWKPKGSMVVNMWNYTAHNLFNLYYIKPTFNVETLDLSISTEFLLQNRIGNGGNTIDSLRYMQDNSSQVVGIQVAKNLDGTNISIGYNHIFDNGKFMFPREWGIEQLFSFQKRERSEGSASNDALVFRIKRNISWKKNVIKSDFSVGHHWKPDATDALRNKYAFPSYTQWNLDLYYHHENFKYVRPELLLIYKKASNNTPENPNFYLNKADQILVNFVVNINF